jgi:RHS repeat-associated protein
MVYDNRRGSTGLALARSYTYDLDGNRVGKVEGGVTFSYVFDRTDQQVSVLKTGGTSQTFGYDAYGNLTGNAETAAAVTAMTYDLGDKLVTIDPTGTANDATFTFDALGRFRTRVLATSTDTYSYLGTSETVLRISNSVGPTVTDSIVSPAGDRLGIKQGTTLNWLLPDLHGNVGASLDAGETTIVNATRYDAYGMTLGTGSAVGAPAPVGEANWKYQGRLDVSPVGLASPLYDMSARFYSPGLGAFTQLDSVMGSAQNPLSMNRFLYALANPATMIDPSGHAPCGPDGIWCQQDSVAQHAKKYVPPKKYKVSHKATGCRYGSEDCHVNKRTAAHKQSICARNGECGKTRQPQWAADKTIAATKSWWAPIRRADRLGLARTAGRWRRSGRDWMPLAPLGTREMMAALSTGKDPGRGGIVIL